MSGCKDDFLVKGVWRVVGPYKVVSFVLMAVWDKIPTILHLISKGKKSLIGVACARETRKMESIQQLEEKFGNFCLVVMIQRAHMRKESKYGNVEGRMLPELDLSDYDP
ncbi:hypothetical protein CK203_021390 [Vitis vinifera]|uniref:Uncharacterized protein n=1 Tax=Vitis vinifera TaxID=29760 RepID=A0A438ISI3_VITVI|nr:hypothetical protein CK203_021390 [Vitis vinifera]